MTTLDEAIKSLSEEIKHPYSAKKMSRPDALKLGKEALLRIKRQRLLTIPVNQPPLPGEEMF